MTDVKRAVGDRTPTTITFVWMQGERDSRDKRAEGYAVALKDLIQQLRDDLHRPDMNFVIGGISDYGNDSVAERPSWNAIRNIQVAVAESDPHGAWVDADDLNGQSNDLHYTSVGYAELGKRFAAKGIELVKKD